MTDTPHHPNSAIQRQTIGVLGGGQLGRMCSHAAQQLGAQVTVFDPAKASPAAQVCTHSAHHAWDDLDAISAWAQGCDAIGVEFENIPLATLEHIEQLGKTRNTPHFLRPNARSIAIAQDRLQEKAFFQSLADETDAPPVPHWSIANADDCTQLPASAFPAILKTCRFGYDGKGQATVHSADECLTAWRELGETACVLEKRVQLVAEYSVIVARSTAGATTHLPIQRNIHRDGILFYTEADYQQSITGNKPELAQLVQAATLAAERLDYVGVLCVEFFEAITADGGTQFYINEMAPRPHNSGHYSMNGCNHSQFELQARCLLGLPLPSVEALGHIAMINLLGDVWQECGGELHEPDWAPILQLAGVHLHLYGKDSARAGRKMGHINLCHSDRDTLVAQRDAICRHLGLEPLPSSS